jgi:transcriptional regulator with XRE-family HTH domain
MPAVEDDEIARARVALGKQLAIARQVAGLSQQELGRAIDYSRSAVANVEIGRQQAAREFWERCETALGAGGLLLAGHDEVEAAEQQRRDAAAQAAQAERQARLQAWRESLRQRDSSAHLAPHDQVSPVGDISVPGPYTQLAVTLLGAERTGGVGPVQRRTAIFGLGGAATLGVAAPGLALEAVRHGLMLSAAEEQATLPVEEWQEILTEYGHSTITMAPVDMLDSLTVDLIAVQLAIGRESNEATKNELRRVAALLAHFMALTVGSLGQLREAGRWWRTARRVADKADDLYTSIWIRGREVVRAPFEHRPLHAVLALTQEAEARAAEAHVGARTSLLSGKAQALAMLGRAEEAEATLRQLHEVFADLPSGVTGNTESWFGWPEYRLRVTESFVHAELGRFAQASEAQDRALTLYPPMYICGPVQIELQRARCLVGGGDTTAGVRHAQDTLVKLPSKHHDTVLVELGRKVLAAVPGKDRRLPAVTEFAEYLVLTGNQLARS